MAIAMRKIFSLILVVCMVFSLLPTNVLAYEVDPDSSQITLTAPSDSLDTLHWTYAEGDKELTGLSDMLDLLTATNSLTAYDQKNNEYTLSVSWAYYGYQDAEGTVYGDQDAADFVLAKENTYYFKPVPAGDDENRYCFSDMTDFLAQVDYFLPPVTKSLLSGVLLKSSPSVTVITAVNDTFTDASPHSVNLNNSTYSLTLNLNPTGFAGTPKLVVSIPKGITLSSYPTASNATLSSYIQSVSSKSESDGSTTLTYLFNTGISAVGFNISLLPTYKLKTGQTCTVTAVVYDGDTQMGTASDSIAITSNPTLANSAYYIPYSDTANQNVDLKTTDYYYVKDYEHFYINYPNHYDYDSLTITVPIPDNATPGYYTSDQTFVALSPGDSYAFTNGTVTYKTDLTFTTDSGATYGTAGQMHGLVYVLSASHALTLSTNYQIFYLYDNSMGAIWFRFPGNTAAGTYTPGCTPKIVAGAGDSKYTLMEYAGYNGLSYNTVSYNFRNYNINDYVYPTMSYSYTSVNTEYYLMPAADNQYLYSSLYNLTGNELTNIKVAYTGGYSGDNAIDLSANIHCYKLVFNLSSSGTNPTTADVTYAYYDASAGTVKTDGHAYLTSLDPTLSLDNGDYFTSICATYDRLGPSAYGITAIRNAYCYNANNLDGSACNICSKILSATMGEQTYGASTWTKMSTTSFYPRTTLAITPWYIGLSGTSSGMDKGTQYSFYFLPSYYGQLKNMCFYFLLPSGYEFQSYTPPASWGVTGSAYTITSRPITVGSETNLGTSSYAYKVPSGTYTLYKIQYTDGVDHKSNDTHNVYFSLGPTVDTAEVKTGLYVPSALCMTTESTVYPFSTGNSYAPYLLYDLFDFDNDGNTTETFTRFYSSPTATQNAAKVISLSGSLTSTFENGSGTAKSYQYNSTGTYKFTIYNGLDSGNTVEDAAINITVPSNGTGIAAKLTGAPVLSGSFLSGAAITYSIDGGLTYASAVEDWSKVTNVRVLSAGGIALASSEVAYISLPFKANFDVSVSSSSTAAFAGSMSYSLYNSGSLASKPNSSTQNCAIKTAPVQVGGSIFKDYDSDGVRDANELNNGKNYNVRLYSGAYSSGTTGLTYRSACTAGTDGSFTLSNAIYLPGTYTIQVALNSTELLNAYSDDWTRDGDYAFYTFTVGGSITGITVNLPVTAPRTLLLNYSSCFLYDNATKKLIATVLPALDGEAAVAYTSSDPDVATVSSDGVLTYVSEGTTTITATVPGYGEGSSDVTATCTVYARKNAYTITLHAGSGVTMNMSDYALSGGVYSHNYTAGTSFYLPDSYKLTNKDPAYYFDGWYDNTEFTGSAAYYISSTDYGNKEYYAKWTRYETTYETTAGTWAYGTFSAALYNVYNGGTIKLLKDVTYSSAPSISKNITLKTDGNARKLTLSYYIFISSGSLTIDDTNLTIVGGSYYYQTLYVYGTGAVNVKAGTISAASYCTIYNDSGTVSISGGTVSGSGNYTVYNNTGTVNVSGGTISNTASTGFGICNAGNGNLYLSGKPAVTGGLAGLYEAMKGTVWGRSAAATPTYYSGGSITVCCGWSPITLGDVVVRDISGTGHFTASNIGSYDAKLISGNLIIAKYDYSGTEASAPELSSRTDSSITVLAQTISGQTVEYACSAINTAPSAGWQTSTAFTGLDDGTTYYFFARVKETNYVLSGLISESTAIATKTTLTAAASMAGYTYGDTVSTPSVSSNPGNGTVTYYYSVVNANNGGTEWTGITSTSLNAGAYYLYAVIAETDDYTGCITAAVPFTVSKANFTSTVNMAGYTYNDTVSIPSISANPGSGAVTYYYSAVNANSGGAEWTGITATSLNAGTYYLYAVIEQTANYNAYTTAATKFTVSPKSVTVIWSGNAASYIYDSTNRGSSITAKYVDADGDNVNLAVTFTYSGNASDFAAAGTYTATASMITADGNYTLTNTTKTVTMAQAAVLVTANDNTITYGDAAAGAGYTITNGAGSALFGTDTFNNTTQYDFGGYTAGSDAGHYAITVSGLANPNYAIIYAAGTLSVVEASITDETIAEQTAVYTGLPLTIGTIPTGVTVNNQLLTVKYSADEGLTYNLDTAPAFTAKGEYTVYYQLSAPNHTPLTGTIAFTVTRNMTNIITGLSCADVVYGNTPAPAITGADFGAKTVTFAYAGSQNGTYEAWKATNAAGTWWVKATITGTNDYIGADAYASFTVKKAGVNAPSLSDRYYTGSRLTAEVAANALYAVKDNTGGVVTGVYAVTLTLTDPDNYTWGNTDSADLPLSYQIKKADSNIITGLSCADVVYGNTPAPAVTGADFGAKTVTFAYAGSRNGTYEAWKATNAAGTWWVKATIAGTNDYIGADAYVSFTVKKAEVNAPSLSDRNYTGSRLTAEVAANALYTVKDNAGGIEAGAYTVTLTLTDPDNYTWGNTDSADLPLSFKIKKADSNAITGMSCADVIYGKTPAPAITGAVYGADTVTYAFSASKDGEYGLWLENSAPGTYWAKATIPATGSYPEATSMIRFTYQSAETDNVKAGADSGKTEPAAQQNGSIIASINNKTPDLLVVVVSIQCGSSEVAFETLTVAAGTTGSIEFKDLAAGFYNTVISTGDYKDTRMLEVKPGIESQAAFTLQNLNQNTAVEVKEGAPDVAVGNLSGVFANTVEDDNKGITQQDLDSQEPIEIRLVADKVEFVDESEKDQLDALSGSTTIGLYVDLSLYKTVGENTTRLISLNEMLDVAIPIPDEMKGRESTIVVYRIHEGEPQTITTNPNSDGEYLEISEGYVVLHVKNFSIYALGYRPAGCPFPWWILLLLLIPAAGGLYGYKRKQKQKRAKNVAEPAH
ncbi:MAG: MBG domain-containing protein [Clostridiaceae bacterium]|nr:MBG domain-containing protein [Clostridiaceae bacterium]